MARANWTRLIRFVALETGRIHLGQPVDPLVDVGLAVHKNQIVKAHEIHAHSATDPAATVTSNVLTVSQLLTPLSRDEVKIVRCLGLNYADHAEEAKLPIPTNPVLFYKPTTALLDPDTPIVIPSVAQPVERHLPDYEVELVIVIGKTAKDVPEDRALDYVLGYTVGNDVSFREHQMAVSQWGFSKSFDGTCPFGPVIVSTRAIADPQKLSLKTTLNDTVLQDGTAATQIFNVKKTVSFLSQGTTLEPGNIILTGTPPGVGFVREPKVYLKDGDNLKLWMDGGIGTLVNSVVEERRAKL